MKRYLRAAARGFTDALRDAWPLTLLGAAFVVGLTLKACGALS